MNKTLLSLIFTVLLVVWLASGALGDDPQVESTNANANNFSVRVVSSEEQVHRLVVELRGRLDADKEVLVAAKLQGQVIATPNREGSQVKAGDVLCEIEAGDRYYQLERAESALRLAELEYEGVSRLTTGGLQSDLALANAENSLAAARLAARQAELAVSYLKITAPFDGIVEQLLTDEGSYIKSGMACARMLDVTPMIFSAQVSESQVAYLSSGQAGTVEIGEAHTVPASVRFIASQADQITRNYTIESVLSLDESLPAGLTAKMRIQLAEVPAHLLAPSVLSLSTNGVLRVKIVNDQSRVEYVPVSLVDETAQGIWVSGLPQRARVIAVGGEFVAEGDQVTVEVVEG